MLSLKEVPPAPLFFRSFKARFTAHLGAVSWQAVATVCLVVALFLFAHPYTGVRHDGTLYAGEAMARIVPGEFHDDLYFLYGSQGRFTLLPAVYAALIAAFGLGVGSIIGLLIAGAFYLASAAYLIAAFVRPKARVIALLSVVLGWSLYGGTHTFAYAEPFLTARSFAEPAVLFGLGLLLRGRTVFAALAFVAALAMHPLIGLGGVVVGWLCLVRTDRRWWLVALAGLLGLGVLAGFEVGPFADLFARYDDVWLSKLRELNPQAFVLQWSLLDYGILVYNVCVLGLAARLTGEPRLRMLAVAAIVAGLGTTLFSVVAVDLALNPFFGKLQVWRAEWVMQWIAMASLPSVLRLLWDRGPHGRIAACFLVMGWLAPFTSAPALLGLFAITAVAFDRRFVVSPPTVRIVVGATVLVAVILFVQVEFRVWSLGTTMDLSAPRIAGQAFSSGVLLMAIGLVFVRWLQTRRTAAMAVAGIALVAAGALWDQRAAWTRTLEAHPLGQPLWADLIEPRAKVYWYGDLIAPWILLGHGNYYTQQQGSGAVFSRDMVIELERRSGLTANLQFQEQLCRMMNNLNAKQSSCEPDRVTVRGICEDAGIDYMVLQSRLEATVPLAEFSTGVVENGFEKRFFLYRCIALK